MLNCLFPEVESIERGYHPNDVRVLQVGHDLHLLHFALLVDLVGKLLLLQWDRFDCVYLTVPAASYLPNDTESAPSEQLLHLEIVSRQIRAIHDALASKACRDRLTRAIFQSQARVSSDDFGSIICRNALVLCHIQHFYYD